VRTAADALSLSFGLVYFFTDQTIRPDELAVEAEARGFDSLFVPEHTHIPISRDDEWPGGGELPPEYKRILDPFIALTASALATEKLLVGTAICLVAQRDAIELAKQVSTLDYLSNGRVVLGVGLGWNTDEMRNHGVDPSQRRAMLREKILAMRALWRDDVAEFQGEYVTLSPSWQWPKPVQRPGPPVFYGGAAGPVTFRHIIEYCDGWMPIAGRGSISEKIEEMHAAAELAGRDPASLGLMAFGVPPKLQVLEHYRSTGMQRALFNLAPGTRLETLRELDRLTALVAEFRAG